MDLTDYIYYECHRQEVANYGDFATAWQTARNVEIGQVGSAYLLSELILGLAYFVEPEKNRYVMRGTSWNNLRVSPVTFRDPGGEAAPPAEVHERFYRFVDHLADAQIWSITGLPHRENTAEEIDPYIKSLLDIHPWADGNGRTASILRNWLLCKLDDPEPLPYYYGGGPTCKRCDGEGTVPKLSGALKCSRCNGKGWLTKKQEGMQA